MVIDRRKLILEAAHKSFSLFGYKATTMDQVAKLANVGKGTIYTFFKNKEELFAEIISSLLKEMKAAAEINLHTELPFHEKVNRTLFQLLEFRKEHQLTIKLFQEERDIGTPAVQEVMQRIEESILNYIQNIILEAIQKGEIKQCKPDITAFIILKLYIALIFDWEKHHKPLNKEEISELFKLYLFQGLSI
ncbi:TetR/AcrR family transcriptional regulator [Bacillus sp. FJAT-49736]|uniref:TetR/AcrR family transcriptional regulator n=1 Tax=Bacillus sp. FJAT-49736 TaxID=2833582 RepID=UPI001BCA5416|nr:TetR/AcrR family transcriptional regulator [Bacillus sp. FJAT-49736]MBS4171969.1 TetR/AcrR family transcriptional regulator [Bacillus sp. FJAT-49736]